jgi:leukotriene-A4 hydrolase
VLAEKWLACSEDDIDSLSSGPSFKDLSPLQQREFIDQLCLSDKVISVKKLQKFDEWYNMKTVRNTEVRFRWLKLTLKARWEDKIEDCIELATIQGRMKYVRPLYRYTKFAFKVVEELNQFLLISFQIDVRLACGS